jgi:PAS domain S-box-containing protein
MSSSSSPPLRSAPLVGDEDPPVDTKAMEAPSTRYLASILENARDAILSTDVDGVVRSANRGAERLFNTPADQLIGVHLAEIVGGQWAQVLPEMVRQVRARAHVERDVACHLEDGTAVHVGLVLATINDADGRQVGVSAIGRDITEHTIALAALARSNADLEQFAFVAAHDLQEPLRKILMLESILEEWHPGGDEAADHLERIRDTAEGMQRLIRDLLSFAKATTTPQNFMRVELDEVIDAVFEDLEHVIEMSGARVQIGSLPQVSGDPRQLRQLFGNLVSNALKFRSADQPPEIEVSGRAEGGFGIVHVADHGIGFDERFLERMFAPFQRLHPKGRFEGSGIGLAICRKIVQRHGGEMEAHAQPGAGATFTVRIPLRGGTASLPKIIRPPQ